MNNRTCSQCGLEAFEGELCAACAAGAFALAALGGRRKRTRRKFASAEPSAPADQACSPSTSSGQAPPKAA